MRFIPMEPEAFPCNKPTRCSLLNSSLYIYKRNLQRKHETHFASRVNHTTMSYESLVGHCDEFTGDMASLSFKQQRRSTSLGYLAALTVIFFLRKNLN